MCNHCDYAGRDLQTGNWCCVPESPTDQAEIERLDFEAEATAPEDLAWTR